MTADEENCAWFRRRAHAGVSEREIASNHDITQQAVNYHVNGLCTHDPPVPPVTEEWQ